LSRFVEASQRFQHDFDAGIEDLVEHLKTADKKALRSARKMINRLIGKPKSSGQKGHPVRNKKKRNEGTK